MDYYKDKMHHSGVTHLQYISKEAPLFIVSAASLSHSRKNGLSLLYSDHCVDSIQCSADVTMMGFEWTPEFRLSTPMFITSRECPGKFAKLVDWMWENGQNLGTAAVHP